MGGAEWHATLTRQSAIRINKNDNKNKNYNKKCIYHSTMARISEKQSKQRTKQQQKTLAWLLSDPRVPLSLKRKPVLYRTFFLMNR